MNFLIAVIAQTQTTPPKPSGMAFLFPAFLMAMVVFMLLSSRSQKKRGSEDFHQAVERHLLRGGGGNQFLRPVPRPGWVRHRTHRHEETLAGARAKAEAQNERCDGAESSGQPYESGDEVLGRVIHFPQPTCGLVVRTRA